MLPRPNAYFGCALARIANLPQTAVWQSQFAPLLNCTLALPPSIDPLGILLCPFRLCRIASADWGVRIAFYGRNIEC